MNFDNLIDEIASKYGYNEELKKAIKITIPLMVDEYGEDSFEDIIKLFKNTRIFSTTDMSLSNRERIEKLMLKNYNSHLTKSDEKDPYQTNNDPGSYYSYETIYDKDMNIIGEARWIVIKDMKGSINEKGYKDLFGTTINMPYFIHEMNHAFAMQNAIYKKKDNTISTKHGMFEQEYTFSRNGDKVELLEESNSHIILEESINEKITQNMLVKLLNAKDYKDVETKLRSFNHITSSYSAILISLAEKLETLLGKDKLLRLRKNNDQTIISEFNTLSQESDIAKKYIHDEVPYEYFSKKCFELFRLKCEGYKMSIDDYSRKSKELMAEAFIPLCAYQDQMLGTMDLEKFDSIRENILGISPESKKI